jgi:hypothetical protein
VTGARYATIVVIIAASAGGVWARAQIHVDRGPDAVLEDIKRSSESSGLRVIGSFQEPLTGKPGLEISFPGCQRPVGLFPVTSFYTEIAPTAFGYESGQYSVSYLYEGHVYSESWITYKLSGLRLLLRTLSFLHKTSENSYSTYMKIWTPVDCAGLSPEKITSLL